MSEHGVGSDDVDITDLEEEESDNDDLISDEEEKTDDEEEEEDDDRTSDSEEESEAEDNFDEVIFESTGPVVDLPDFQKLPLEVRFKIWREAFDYDGPKQCKRKIEIKMGRNEDGNFIYYAVSYRSSNSIPSACQEARDALKPLYNYVALCPKTQAGAKQPTIVFNPELDTLHFYSPDFDYVGYVHAFLERITRKERDLIQNISFRMLDQSWYDGDELPCADTLLLMHNLKRVTFLEDRRGKREAEPTRWHKAHYLAQDLNDAHRSWKQAVIDFKLDWDNL